MPVQITEFVPVDSSRMRYLGRLIKMGRSHPSKRADWIKFCHVCGVDISASGRRRNLLVEY